MRQLPVNEIGELRIDNIDLDLLEEQRKLLQEVMDQIYGKEKDGAATVTLTHDQIEALKGIENMLDAWSDEREERRRT
jgi:hypothetical protein